MMSKPAETINSPKINGGKIFPYSRWQAQTESLAQKYRNAEPFPYIMLDHFLEPAVLEEALGEFPGLDSENWIHYVHVNEKKYGKTDSHTFGPTLKAIIDELNSPAFVRFLVELTGIKGLFADTELEGGGLHQSGPGGFLNIHADFTVHPHQRNWRRRVNVLVYLNQNWSDAYGGHLELWDRQMKRRMHKITPLFNRSVIFSTNHDSFHGHPEPLACPEGMTRKSIALYYFTKEAKVAIERSTEYRARPGDGVKAAWIYLDKMVLRFYDAVKRQLGFSDRFASNFLKSMDALKRKMQSKKNRNP